MQCHRRKPRATWFVLALVLLVAGLASGFVTEQYTRRFGRQLHIPLNADQVVLIYEGYPPGSLPGAGQDEEVGLGAVMIGRARPLRAAVLQGQPLAFIAYGRGRTLLEWRSLKVAGQNVARRSPTGEISLGF